MRLDSASAPTKYAALLTMSSLGFRIDRLDRGYLEVEAPPENLELHGVTSMHVKGVSGLHPTFNLSASRSQHKHTH